MTPGWTALTTAVEQATALIAEAAPDAGLAAEGDAYVTRIVTTGLAGAVLGHLFRDDGLSRALPCHGGPNPDYRMYHAMVDPSVRYRLTGRLNGSERVGIGLYRFGENGTLVEAGYAAFDMANCPEGDFALEVASGAAGPGVLSLSADARIMLIRVLHRGPASEAAAISLDGGPAATGLSLMTASNDGALEFVAASLVKTVREYLKWTEAVCGLRNSLGEAPAHLAETVQGDPDTLYLLGNYDLDEHDWLEVTMPAGLPGYWSLHAYSFWFEHLQTPGADDRNARPDEDGMTRIAVGPKTPAASRNRIDTLGRRQGALICRIIGRPKGRPTAVVRTLP